MKARPDDAEIRFEALADHSVRVEGGGRVPVDARCLSFLNLILTRLAPYQGKISGEENSPSDQVLI